jgi:hypothetical protein
VQLTRREIFARAPDAGVGGHHCRTKWHESGYLSYVVSLGGRPKMNHGTDQSGQRNGFDGSPVSLWSSGDGGMWP